MFSIQIKPQLEEQRKPQPFEVYHVQYSNQTTTIAVLILYDG